MTSTRSMLTVCLLFVACLSLCAHAAKPGASSAKTLDAAYPGVVSGVLSFATLTDLPKGQILESGKIQIGQEAINAEIAKMDESKRVAMERNQLFLLEQIATKDFLLRLAREEGLKNNDVVTTGTESELIGSYLRSLGSKATVTDKEVADFYQQNKDMVGGAPFDQVRAEMKELVLQENQQKYITEYFRTLGQRIPIRLASAWVREQAARTLDNPVDKARKSGLPSLVDFGADSCRACEMMAPVLKSLKKKYEGKVNVLFLHVRQEEALASRYGIQSIPVQVFFDKRGKEVSRHTGFLAQSAIEKQLGEMGVR